MRARRWMGLAGLVVSLSAAGGLAADQPFNPQRQRAIGPSALASDRPASDPQVQVAPGSEELYSEIKGRMRDLEPAQTVASLAQSFLGTPYVAFSLDEGGAERLRVDLTRFDCMLLVEQLLALAVSSDWPSFVATTQTMRYEAGRVDYCSRHHYFQSWAASAADQGWVEDVTDQVAGHQRRVLNLTYMSDHPSLYSPLQTPSTLRCIQEKERRLTIEQIYLPNDGLELASRSFQNGDLFAIATSVPGLDVTHMGVVVSDADGVSAIHAVPGKGVIRSHPFAAYVRSVPASIGVVVLRPRSTRASVQEQPST